MSSSRRGSTLIWLADRAAFAARAARESIVTPASRQPARASASGRIAIGLDSFTWALSLVFLEHLAEVLVEGLELEVLEVGELGDGLGLLVLEAPGDVDDADVRADDQVIELVRDLGEHRLGEASAEGLRFVEHGAELVAGRRQLFLFSRQVTGHGGQTDGCLSIDALGEVIELRLYGVAPREHVV